MTGMLDGTTGTTVGTTAEDDDELLEDGRAPPPPAPLRRELIDAVDNARADERTEPKPGVHVAVAKLLSSHSEIWKRGM